MPIYDIGHDAYEIDKSLWFAISEQYIGKAKDSLTNFYWFAQINDGPLLITIEEKIKSL